jgi:DNA-binding SARP family transcriptional activator/DNA-binding beta-propeller fold protein YncE
VAAPDAKREFRILGPFEVCEDGRSLPVGSGKQRSLLALLLLNAGEVVSTDRLIDALWGESPPASAPNSVHIYVSQLRKVLGDGCLLTRGHGYVLALEPGQLDFDRFERMLDEGRTLLVRGDTKGAGETLREALALWRGAPLVDFGTEPFAQREIARLEDLRLTALEARIDADLGVGRHSRLVGELDALTATNPLHERFWAQLMLALYRSGRQTDALSAYQKARRALAEQVGLAPGPELQRLEKAILAHDPSLEFERRGTRAPPRRSTGMLRRRWLLAGTVALVGAVALATAAVLLTRENGPDVLSAISPDSIGIVDPERNALVGQIALHTRPAAIAFGAGSLWVATSDRETLLQIDPRTHNVAQTIGLGAEPTAIAVGDGYVWVLCSRGKLLFQFDGDTGVPVSKRILRTEVPDPAGRGLPYGRLGFEIDEPLDLAAGGGAAWIAYVYEVSRVDAKTGTVTHVRAGAAGGIAFGERAAWAVGQLWIDSPGLFVRIDAETRTVTGTIPMANVGLQRAVEGMAAGASGVWAISRNQTAWKIDTQVGLVATVTPLNHTPADIAIGEEAVWTANEDGTVSRIDAKTGTPARTIPLGKYPRIAYPVQLAAGGGAIWVAVH